MDKPTISLLRWAGSKRKALPRIAQYWNLTFNKYIEPFAGSASLFFFLSPKQSILGDLNSELIETWLAIRDQPNQVFASLRNRPINSAYYYKLRNSYATREADYQKAARFLYLNRFCFNGIYRTNLNGIFNVPYSGVATGKKSSLKQIQECSLKLKNTLLLNGDFETIVKNNLQLNDFVYLDPPYATGTRRIFKEYHASGFGLKDLERLASLLTYIDNKKSSFVLSYAYCSEALALFSKWNVDKYYVQRNIAGFAKNRRMAAELLITNINL